MAICTIVRPTSVLEGIENARSELPSTGFTSDVSPHCTGVADAVVPSITGEFITTDAVENCAAASLAPPGENLCDAVPWLRYSVSSGSTIGLLPDHRYGRRTAKG
jgi:hypothetical protein